jgi:hypothetical protein
MSHYRVICGAFLAVMVFVPEGAWSQAPGRFQPHAVYGFSGSEGGVEFRNGFPVIDPQATVAIEIVRGGLQSSEALPNIRLGAGVDPFTGRLRTEQRCATPTGLTFSPGPAPSASVQITVDLDYEAFASHSIGNLTASAGIGNQKPEIGGKSGSATAQVSSEARTWQANRNIGIRFAMVETAGVQSADAITFDFGSAPNNQLQRRELLNRCGEFFVSEIHRHRGVIVTLVVTDVDRQKYESMAEKYRVAGSYDNFRGEIGSDLQSSIAQGYSAGRIMLRVDVIGEIDRGKLSGLTPPLPFSNNDRNTLEGRLQTIVSNAGWTSDDFSEIRKFIASATDILKPTPAPSEIEAVGVAAAISAIVVRRYPREQFHNSSVWSAERFDRFKAVADRNFEMESDRQLIAVESGSPGWVRSVLNNAEFGILEQLVSNVSFGEFLDRTTFQLAACRLDGDDNQCPTLGPPHPYATLMPRVRPAAPTARWQLTLPDQNVLTGSDAENQLVGGFDKRNFHPFFNFGGRYQRPYIGNDVGKLELILDAPYMLSYQVGISGGSPPGNHIFNASIWRTVGAGLSTTLDFSAGSTEISGRKFALGFYHNVWR